jgi:HAD superfamily hydrolase (TIGR01549 family)
MTQPPRIPRALVFDVDGTLYSQRRLRWKLLPRLGLAVASGGAEGWRCARVLREYRRQLESMRALPAGACTAEVHFRRTAAATALDERFVRQCIGRWFEQEPLAHLAACSRAGLTEFLDRARHAGIRLGVFSDYPVEEKLKALGISRYFEETAWGGEAAIAALKPHPDGLLRVLSRLGVAPSEAAYVGDRSDVDAESARRAGCASWIVGRGGIDDYFALARRIF